MQIGVELYGPWKREKARLRWQWNEKKENEREREGGNEKKRAERIRVKSHFSKPQRVSTELADLPLEKCWGYRGV